MSLHNKVKVHMAQNHTPLGGMGGIVSTTIEECQALYKLTQ
jgi:hypothetical protein